MTFWRGQNAKDRKQVWSWGGGRGVDSRGAYEEVMEMCVSQSWWRMYNRTHSTVHSRGCVLLCINDT